MIFQTDQTSIHGGEPQELYRLLGPGGRAYFYTGHGVDLTYNGDTYTALPLIRTAIEGRQGERSVEVVVDLPYDADVITHYAFADAAPAYLDLTIFRRHGNSGDVVTWYEGRGGLITVEGEPARGKIRFPSALADSLQQGIPEHYYQAQCPHTLFDRRCGLDIADFEVAATVSSVTNGTALVVSTVDGEADQFFRGGEIVRDSDGERRMIVSQIGTALIISSAFPDSHVTDAVTLVPGCDRLKATCIAKFANVENFGGHPTIPTFNVFATDLRQMLRGS